MKKQNLKSENKRIPRRTFLAQSAILGGALVFPQPFSSLLTGKVIARTNALADIERRCLFPGEVKTVRILGKHKEGEIKAKAWYSPHIAIANWNISD